MWKSGFLSRWVSRSSRRRLTAETKISIQLAAPEFGFLARADWRFRENWSHKPDIRKSLIALNLIDMKKLILLLTAVLGLGVVAQAADPSPSPSASAPKKHHHHKAKAPSSPAATKPAASPKASASPKT
ncbi:MAG: hypothetical protein QOH31_4227 [Verrucomicrobiota bacterium]